ncbi:WhiB family transcriptional regulator [Streptomyces luteireticuli]|uniref:WhiB family transcriptional regulator n=1 Tax=Streptomyces luteireticuli TaxID=173858 RepID=UPI003556C71E
MPLEVFFPPPGGGSRSTAKARAICSGCPVREECLAEAMSFRADQQYGVSGGKTARTRQKLLRAADPRPDPGDPL